MANDDAIAILVGIPKITIIIGTKRKAPAAQIIPAKIPTKREIVVASTLLILTLSHSESVWSFDLGKSINKTARVAKIAYTILIMPSDKMSEVKLPTNPPINMLKPIYSITSLFKKPLFR